MSTLNNVVKYLQTTDGPKTILEIASYLAMHSQTVREYVTQGVEQGLLKKEGKRGKAYLYTAAYSNNRDGMQTFLYKGAAVPISEVLYMWATDASKRPSGGREFYMQVAFNAIQFFYNRALNALDENNPKPLTITDLREARMTLIQFADKLRQDLQTIDSLIGNDNLWHPKEMPMNLILKDEQFTPYQLKEMLEATLKEEPK